MIKPTVIVIISKLLPHIDNISWFPDEITLNDQSLRVILFGMNQQLTNKANKEKKLFIVKLSHFLFAVARTARSKTS